MRRCSCGNDVADNARFCPKCGHRFTSRPVKMLAWIFGLIFGCAVLGGIISAVVGNESSSNESVRAGTNTAHYTVPAKFQITPIVERGSQGEIYISGTTNFPDGMKMWVILGPRKAQQTAFIQNGRFRSGALYPDTPVMGKQPLEITAYFNAAWQNPTVLGELGEGGKNLKGALFRQTDPDVIDSDKILDAKFVVTLPPILPQTEAISLVKRAILTVPDKGRSATDIEKNIALFEQPGGGVTVAKGWAAIRTSPDSFNVLYDFNDGTSGEKQAIWSANLKTRQVKYVNEAAKLFSWTPDY